MFGYVRPYEPELKVREAEYYRAVYCGLCRSMKKHLGATSPVTLSYDMAFLALCRMCATGETPGMSRRRCVKLKKRPMADDCDALAYSASVSALLLDRKLSDDIADEDGMRRLRARMMSSFARRYLRRANVDVDLTGCVDGALLRLYELEKSADATVSDCAAAFGDALSAVFAHGLDGGARRIMAEIGRSVGRFVYIIDEVDDMDRDVDAGRRNRIAELYPRPWTESTKDAVTAAMCLELERAINAAELFDGGNETARSVVINILSMGMKSEAGRVSASRLDKDRETAKKQRGNAVDGSLQDAGR